jgi:hypothetical protein
MPEYTSPLVDHLPEHPTVVSPTRHFGYPVGRPGHLHRTADVHGYMEALAASSPRVQIDWLGATEEGQRMMVVQVGSEQNLARLEETRLAMNRLSDPRGTPRTRRGASSARRRSSTPSSRGCTPRRPGPPEMVMEMAYRLAASDDPRLAAIRDSAVVFIVPVAEPTGATGWWSGTAGTTRTSSAGRTAPRPAVLGEVHLPRHQPRRDAAHRAHHAGDGRALQPLALPVGHDLHESVPYLYVSTGTGPYNPAVDPITVSEWQWFSNFEVTALTAHGDAGRVDARLLRRLVSRLPALGAQRAQRHRPLLRDVRQQRPQHHGAPPGRAADARGVVPPQPAAHRDHLVAAQQHQLHADGGAHGAAARGAPTARASWSSTGPRRTTR